MEITEFCKKVNEFKDNEADKKDYILKMVMPKRYIGYLEKMSIIKNLINATQYKKDPTTNNLRYVPDSATMALFYSLTIIKNYTKIEIDFSDNPAEQYDSLNKCGALKVLLSAPELKPEMDEMMAILRMMTEDVESVEHSVRDYLDTKAEILTKVINSGLDTLLGMTKNGKMDEIKKAIESVTGSVKEN